MVNCDIVDMKIMLPVERLSYTLVNTNPWSPQQPQQGIRERVSVDEFLLDLDPT